MPTNNAPCTTLSLHIRDPPHETELYEVYRYETIHIRAPPLH